MLPLEDITNIRGMDFYLTKSCNKTCHYCTAWTKEMRNLHIDMDFFSELLTYFEGHQVRIQLLGGEPGLVKNLDEAINEIKKHDNLIPVVLSNSFVRRRYPWVLEDPEVVYMEHLVLDFHEDRIEKLGPKFDFFDENDLNNYNIIIRTPGFEAHAKKHNIDYLRHKNTQFKEYNSRSPSFEPRWQAPELKRRICAAFPSVPVLDFEMMKIRHCSKKVINGSRTYDITRENIQAMLNYELFEYEDYCKKCMEPIGDRPEWQVLDIMEVGKV